MNRIALAGVGASLSAATLEARVQQLTHAFERAQPRPHMLGLIADNGPDWVIADLAAERLQLPLVPLPGFFMLAQLQHVVDATGMDALLCDAPGVARALGFAPAGDLAGTALPWFRRAATPATLPVGTSKITFTSGTTGTPKGVCLSVGQQRAVAASLVEATRELGIDRHLSLLPLAVLLENIAGVHAPLAAGATCCVPSLGAVGVGGSTGFDPRLALGAIAHWQADSIILLPQMLMALTGALEAGAARPTRLRFAAVGGAKVAPALIERARAVGIPAHEGYGISECASVVALNVPGADLAGTVGRPLKHVGVRIDGGEIVIDRAGFLGYLGTDAPELDELRTGDLGTLDDDGYLRIQGRHKHQLITSFGRNVAPEWPEAELTSARVIAQAAVFGEARPQLSAVIVSPSSVVTDATIDAAVHSANARLPDYAQVAVWVRAEAPFSVANGLATANGRVRRDAVWERYGARLDSLYEDSRGGPSMPYFEVLEQQTAAARADLLAVPVIRDCLTGRVTRAQYLAFLAEAYHHVKHTVPLLMACGSRLPESKAWLRTAIVEYIAEEAGHEEWILNDIAAAGGDPDAVRRGAPSEATELMIAYIYDTIARGNPVGFFGMVHVLEGTSIALATHAAQVIRSALELPPEAFTYLTSHGTLDQQHVLFFAGLMDRLDDPVDQAAVTHAATRVYRLYGDIFRGLPRFDAAPIRKAA